MKVAILATLAFVAMHSPAHAYLDPGTGSMILQGIIGAMAVGAATVTVYWNKLRSLFSGRARER